MIKIGCIFLGDEWYRRFLRFLLYCNSAAPSIAATTMLRKYHCTCSISNMYETWLPGFFLSYPDNAKLIGECPHYRGNTPSMFVCWTGNVDGYIRRGRCNTNSLCLNCAFLARYHFHPYHLISHRFEQLHACTYICRQHVHELRRMLTGN